MVDLMSGQVNVMITTMASAGPHVKAGKLRALAVTGDKRNADFPDVPTFAEVGVKGMDYEQWFGLMGPANMPQPVAKRLSDAIVKALNDPEVKAKLSTAGMVVPADASPAALAALQKRDYELKGKVIRDAGVKSE